MAKVLEYLSVSSLWVIKNNLLKNLFNLFLQNITLYNVGAFCNIQNFLLLYNYKEIVVSF
jgi:hypothetical protein